MSELISRQEAIDALREKVFHDLTDEFYGTMQVLDELPSAQPEVRTQMSSADCISRQAAIEAMNTRLEDVKLTWRGKVKKGEIAMYLDMRGVIETLPSAQPEPHWIPTKVKPYPDLPEDDMSGYFLVTLHTYGNIGFDMDKYEVKKMRWNRVKGWFFPVHSPAWIEEALTQEVLAWKPCPEPYREDGVK